MSKGGMKYQALVIPERISVSPDAEKVLSRLEAEGAKIIRCDRGEKVNDALESFEMAPDLSFVSANLPDDKTLFFHRQLPDSDVYFIYNHSDHSFDQEIGIRTPYKNIELWNPYIGEKTSIDPLGNSNDAAGLKTNISIPPYQSRIIVIY